MIKDLEGNGAAFDAEAASWIVTSPLGTAAYPYTSNCAGTSLLGGYGILDTTTTLERSYLGLPTHNIIYLKASIWILDSWSASVEGITMEIDASPF